ncbi:MAG: hypothetical protein NVSMB48_14070 [Marmoricola sp.]
MKSRIRAALVVASTLAGAGILAGPAQASTLYPWGTLGAGNLAKATGHVYNNGGVQIEDASYQYQIENGDNGAYVSSAFMYWESGYDCGYNASFDPISCWYRPSTDFQTKRTKQHSWVWGASYEGLREYGTAARAQEKVCEDISWWPDTCSATATLTFSY